MPPLTHEDVQSILDFLKHLYIPCEIETFGNLILAEIPKVVGSELTFYSRVSFQDRQIAFENTSRQHTGLNLEQLFQIAHQYFYEHPHIVYQSRTGDCRTYKISDFIDRNQLHSLEGVYHQYLHPMGMEDEMTVTLPCSPAAARELEGTHNPGTIVIGLHREEWSFTERDRYILDLLRPHLHQAYQNAVAFSTTQQTLRQLTDTAEQSGVVILSWNGQVQFITQCAIRLLDCYFPGSTADRSPLPDTLRLWVKHQISQVTPMGDMPNPGLPLQIEQHNKRLNIRFVPNQPQAQYFLFLEEQTLQSISVDLLELLGLTHREAEVLFWIIKGKRIPEIAKILQMSDRTVRKHLEHIYAKLDVNTRAAAITHALARLGVLQT